MRPDLRSRATGALYGLAIGDALGMPTQSMSRPAIVARYGELLTGFEPGPADQPLAPGMPAGAVTDDTEQALLLARLLIDAGGRVDPREWGARLLRWEDRMRARGSLDLLGPSTRRALQALADGADPATTGRSGDTNGAAMRITPVAIAAPAGDRAGLVERVVEASTVTHGTSLALAGAAAVAAAVGAALDGADLAEATGEAVAAARLAADRGRWVAGAPVAERIDWAVSLVAGCAVPEAIRLIDALVGTSLHAQESVPAAFAVLHAAGGDPWLACRIGASVGGDCDTIAAMAGAVAGALHGVEGLPVEAVARVEEVNALGVPAVVDGLLALRP